MSGGVSVRYVQDKISNCLANNHEYVNMFMVLNELKEGLTNSSLFTNKEQVGRYMTCIDLVVKKLTEILKNEVQRALVGDEDAIIRLCTNYNPSASGFKSFFHATVAVNDSSCWEIWSFDIIY